MEKHANGIGNLTGDGVTGNSRHTNDLGPEARRFENVLLFFHQVGRAFQSGANSLAEVAVMLEARDLSGQNNFGICSSTASVTRQCKMARVFFGQVFGIDGLAPLFRVQGRGKAINGLTPLGEQAWQLTHRYLVSRETIKEHD